VKDRPGLAHPPSARGVARLLAALTPVECEVLHLRIRQGYRVDEVATVLGVGPHVVLMVQHRALNRLREALRESTRGPGRGLTPVEGTRGTEKEHRRQGECS
jgi:DNA-directed RNA polymerase specialized sigma24 family protein